MPIDPFFIMVLMIPVGASLALHIIGKRMRQAEVSMGAESRLEQEARIMYQSLPFLVRAEVEKDEKLLLVGRAIMDAAVTVDEFGAAFTQMISSKKGCRQNSSAAQALEDLEAQFAQPQRYHAAELPDGWHVVYIDDNGDDAIACRCDDEWDARCQAAALNIADAPQDDPVTMLMLVEHLRRQDG